ncbi:DUF3325 family protein [Rhodopseudomonas sp. HC1]|uniref:DUF3325 family protein n=1 Tax=Rhodopseudomonas infernalis TaxID=2897386 RepID=UPI001EE8B265|nr:DUF3325 family protein [Rhodopseudomonas infernalis]MCG6203211.1 DUF3325 family protein [Rhodopseudomonas infernalis]
MIHALALAFSLAGFAALALATRRQQNEFLRRSLPRRIVTALRIAGSAALLVALILLVIARGWALGLVMFSGHTTLAAALVYAGLIIFGRNGLGVPVRRS